MTPGNRLDHPFGQTFVGHSVGAQELGQGEAGLRPCAGPREQPGRELDHRRVRATFDGLDDGEEPALGVSANLLESGGVGERRRSDSPHAFDSVFR